MGVKSPNPHDKSRTVTFSGCPGTKAIEMDVYVYVFSVYNKFQSTVQWLE